MNLCFPLGSSLLSVLVDHFPAAAVVVTLATSVLPGSSKTCTTTAVFSLAVPENAGTVLFDSAFGPTIDTVGGFVSTSKFVSLLWPSPFPSPLFSVAYALKWWSPVLSVVGEVDQLPPEACAAALATCVEPSKMWTTISPSSFVVPENVGLVLFEISGRVFRESLGASVLTSKDTGSLWPSPFPRPLFSFAYAENVCFPVGSVLLSVLVDQLPPAAVVVALSTSVLLGSSKTCTTTVVFSLAVPENEGVTLFEGDGGPTIDTTGGSVLTSKDTVSLWPSPFPSPLFSIA